MFGKGTKKFQDRMKATDPLEVKLNIQMQKVSHHISSLLEYLKD